LSGVTFAAFAAPAPENRRRFLMWSGIASLGVFITGFGMLGMLHYGWPGWVLVKIFCWLLISGMAGIAFRQQDKIRNLFYCTAGLILLALCMVYLKPF
jgi:hypothetical protein